MASVPKLILTVKPEAALELAVQYQPPCAPFFNEYQPARKGNAIVARSITVGRSWEDLALTWKGVSAN